MSIRRFMVVIGLIALLVAAPSVAVVSATENGTASGGCAPQGGWTLWVVSDLLDALGMTEVPPSMDNNEDGLTCVRLQTLANGRKGWIGVTFVDNTVN